MPRPQVVEMLNGGKVGRVGRLQNLQITIATIHHLVTRSVTMLRYVTKHFIPKIVVNSGPLVELQYIMIGGQWASITVATLAHSVWCAQPSVWSKSATMMHRNTTRSRLNQ